MAGYAMPELEFRSRLLVALAAEADRRQNRAESAAAGAELIDVNKVASQTGLPHARAWARPAINDFESRGLAIVEIVDGASLGPSEVTVPLRVTITPAGSEEAARLKLGLTSSVSIRRES